MEEKILLEKLKNTIERATKNLIMINSYDHFRGITATGGEELHIYSPSSENFVNTMIYHEMLNEGIPMVDIIMESEISNKKQENEKFAFHIDNVVSNKKIHEFFIEVKTFGTYHQKNHHS